MYRRYILGITKVFISKVLHIIHYISGISQEGVSLGVSQVYILCITYISYTFLKYILVISREYIKYIQGYLGNILETYQAYLSHMF